MGSKDRNLCNTMCRISISALSYALFVPSVLGQVVSGSIYGTVTDSSGAVLRGAAVTATNISTAALKTTKTDASGDYNFPVLDPGDYKILVQVTGFQSQTHCRYP